MSVNTCRRWTEEECDMLKRSFGTNTHAELAQQMDRSKGAVMQKCHQLGLLHNTMPRYLVRNPVDGKPRPGKKNNGMGQYTGYSFPKGSITINTEDNLIVLVKK